MNIVWYGDACFQITSQIAKDNLVKIVIDPLKDKTGFKVPKLEANILLESSNRIDLSRIKGDPFVINGPGEFEIKGVFAQGISIPESAIAYILEAENIRICHLGNLGAQNINNNGILEKIGDVDILMISVGGNNGLNAQQAAGIVKQIDPHLIIPMLYKVSKIPSSLETADNFFKIIGKRNVEKQNKLSIKKRDLLKMEKEIIVLEP